MSDTYADALFLDQPETLAALGAVDPAGGVAPAQIVFIRVAFEVEGFGSFIAGGFNTLLGATGGTFRGGMLIPLTAKAEPGHRFSHWEFRNRDGSPVFGGSNPKASVLPSLGLVIKAIFKEVTAGPEPGSAATTTWIDPEGLDAKQAGPEVFAPEKGDWIGVEGPLPAVSVRAAKITCESRVGSVPSPICRNQPQRMETTHKVKIENATDLPVEGTLVGRLEIAAFDVKSEKKEKFRVSPRSSKTFELTIAGTLKPNRTGSFSLGAITRIEGPAATPAATAKGFEVKDC